MINDNILKSEERVVLKLRDMYRAHGYSCFKMNKFEEYDLYSQNKDFLVSDSVITFNDTNGKLMALKPDVTLSIVKNYKGDGKGVQRVYYNENVYRISDKTHTYKEIMQTGLECLGNVTDYNLFEVVCLAVQSLMCISDRSILNISHLGILSSLLSKTETGDKKGALIKCISEKNPHGVTEICQEIGVDENTLKLLLFMTEAYGCPEDVCEKLRSMTDDKDILSALGVLETTSKMVKKLTGATVKIDLSIINDTRYYNGLVFQGFVEGIPSTVLSGGQYDKLMTKLGKTGRAIGFAVYLDLLERMKANQPYDVDVLLIYKDTDDISEVYLRALELRKNEKSVSVQTEIPDKLLYKELEYFKGEK